MVALVAISGEQFPATSAHLNTAWDQNWRLSEIALAAFLSGRHPRDRFEFGLFSVVDMLQKLLLVWTHLRVDGDRFVRSGLYRSADRSEKVGVSYSIGQALAHLFLTTVLDVPFTLHVDRYAAEYELTWIRHGGLSPDLIGLGNGWVVAEAKGRTRGQSTQTLDHAAEQKRAIRTIAGERPQLRLASLSHFGDGTLALHVKDPEADVRIVDLPGSRFELLRAYYDPILRLTRGGGTRRIFGTTARFVDFPGLDVSIGVAMGIASSLRSESKTLRLAERISDAGPDLRHADDMMAITSSGLAIILGTTWDPEVMSREPWERKSNAGGAFT